MVQNIELTSYGVGGTVEPVGYASFLRVYPLDYGDGTLLFHLFLNPQAVGMASHKIQNVTNVKFKSLALVFNS